MLAGIGASERAQMPKVLFVLVVLLCAVFGGTVLAHAQEGPGGAINAQRDCQTLTTCNFRKGGSWRGCLSSYSCRTCRFVPTPCSNTGRKARVCQQLICGWGGA